MTNEEKFKEVFGYEPDIDICPVRCYRGCPYEEDFNCNYKWWQLEYKENNK